MSVQLRNFNVCTYLLLVVFFLICPCPLQPYGLYNEVNTRSWSPEGLPDETKAKT